MKHISTYVRRIVDHLADIDRNRDALMNPDLDETFIYDEQGDPVTFRMFNERLAEDFASRRSGDEPSPAARILRRLP